MWWFCVFLFDFLFFGVIWIYASFTKGNTVDVCQTAEMWPFWLIAQDTSQPHLFLPTGGRKEDEWGSSLGTG